MMSRGSLIAIVALGVLHAGFNTAFAQPPAQVPFPTVLPFVSPIFGDNMVLQRNKADKIWGWSEPGDTVRVEIGDKTASAVAGADRRWQVEIPGTASGRPVHGEDYGTRERRVAQRSGGRCVDMRRAIEYGVQAARRAEWS